MIQMKNGLAIMIEEDSMEDKPFLNLNDSVDKEIDFLYTTLILSLKRLSKKKLKDSILNTHLITFYEIYEKMKIIDLTLSDVCMFHFFKLLEKYIDYIIEGELYEAGYNFNYYIKNINIGDGLD